MGSLGLSELMYCGGIHLVELVDLLHKLLTSTDDSVGDKVLLGLC